MEFLSIINQLGPTALIILLMALNITYIKQSKEKTEALQHALSSQNDKHFQEMEALRTLVNNQGKAHKEEVKALTELIQNALESQKEVDRKQDEQITYLQLHYVPKEDMYAQFGGWRTEIAGLQKSINHLTELVGTIRGEK